MVGIKDFGMPSVCENCNMCRDGYCAITDEFCSDRENKKDDNCPLVHAIQIDRIKQLREEIKTYKHGNGNIYTCALNKSVEFIDNMIKEYE